MLPIAQPTKPTLMLMPQTKFLLVFVYATRWCRGRERLSMLLCFVSAQTFQLEVESSDNFMYFGLLSSFIECNQLQKLHHSLKK